MSKNNQLSVFKFEEAADVRVIMRGNEPWFVAKDVCDVLELSNSRVAVQSLDDDEKGVSKVYTPSGEQRMTTINESGLYALVIRSNKPNARKFRKWITSEVLPSIRKTGSYSIQPELPLPDALPSPQLEYRGGKVIPTKYLAKELNVREVKINNLLVAHRAEFIVGKDIFLVKSGFSAYLPVARSVGYPLDRRCHVVNLYTASGVAKMAALVKASTSLVIPAGKTPTPKAVAAAENEPAVSLSGKAAPQSFCLANRALPPETANDVLLPDFLMCWHCLSDQQKFDFWQQMARLTDVRAYAVNRPIRLALLANACNRSLIILDQFHRAIYSELETSRENELIPQTTWLPATVARLATGGR